MTTHRIGMPPFFCKIGDCPYLPLFTLFTPIYPYLPIYPIYPELYSCFVNYEISHLSTYDGKRPSRQGLETRFWVRERHRSEHNPNEQGWSPVSR